MFKSKEKMVTDQLKRVYAFGKDANGKNVTEGNTNMKAILGGKGANLAEMANIGLPVPPGFTISCQTCMEYANSNNTWPEGVLDTIQEYRLDLEERIGKKIGDAEDPLLVSVRSGAPMSMPGMMDTVLNLGLNDQSINGLIKQTENPRFAWDSYRRFIQMFSNVVMGLDGDLFENAINLMKRSRGVETDTDLSAEDLQELVAEFKKIFSENVDAAEYPSLVVDGAVQFPQSPDVQLQLAIEAVFGSWNNPRAILYRKQNKISDDLGTAVNVQSMIFGNKGNTSATGVAFTRNPTATTLLTHRAKTLLPVFVIPAPLQSSRKLLALKRLVVSSKRYSPSSKTISAICATSSSPLNRVSFGCFRPVLVSVLLLQLCTSQSRWSRKALSPRKKLYSA